MPDLSQIPTEGQLRMYQQGGNAPADQAGPWTSYQNTPTTTPPRRSFEIQSGGKTFEVEAPDEAAAERLARMPTHELMNLYRQDGAQNTDDMQTSALSEGMPSLSRPHYSPQEIKDAYGNIAHGIDTGVRQFAKGVPGVGSYLDEANAATRAMFGGDYDSALSAERQRDKTFEAANPYLSTGLQLGGGVAGTAAAIGAAPATAAAMFGGAGRSLVPRMAAGAASGGGLGLVHGFGAGEGGFEQRKEEALRSGAIGAGVGTGLPLVTGAVGYAADAVARRAAGNKLAGDLGVSRGAVNRIAQDVKADELTPTSIQQRAAELGSEGRLLDYGRNLQGRAEALAGLPGQSQNTILNAVESRVRDTAPRLGSELDASLGKSPNLVQLAEEIEKTYGAKIKPAYDSVMAANPKVWDDQLERLSRRPSIGRAMDDAVTLAREHGDDIVSPFIAKEGGGLTLREGANAAPNLAYWDYVKKSIDGRINAFARNPDIDSAGKQSMAALLDSRNTLVDHLDHLTGGAYKQARDLAANKFAIKDALETGQDIFSNKMLPEHFGDMLSGMGAIERQAVAAGARRALERIREVAPASISEGGNKVYRELLQGGANGDTAQKLRMLLGDKATGDLIGTAQREMGFQNAYNTIAGNSRTQPRLAAAQDMTPSPAPNFTVTDLANRLPMTVFDRAYNAMRTSAFSRSRNDLAKLLTARGSDAARAADQITTYAQRGSRRLANDSLARALLTGPMAIQARR